MFNRSAFAQFGGLVSIMVWDTSYLDGKHATKMVRIRPDKSMKPPPRALSEKDRLYLRAGTSPRRMKRLAVAA